MDLRGQGEKEIVDQYLPSTLDSVDQAESIIMEAAEKNGFEEDDLHKIGMAARECVVNAVVHGNRYNANKRVHLNIRVSEEQMTIRVADQGEGFDFNGLPDPLAAENLLKHSGRGIFLMRAFMDEVDIRPGSSGGTEFTLIKKKIVS